MSHEEHDCPGCEDAQMVELLNDRQAATIHNALVYGLSLASSTYTNPNIDMALRHEAFEAINLFWDMMWAFDEEMAASATTELPGVDEATDGICPTGYDELQAQVEADLDAELAGMNAADQAMDELGRPVPSLGSPWLDEDGNYEIGRSGL